MLVVSTCAFLSVDVPVSGEKSIDRRIEHCKTLQCALNGDKKKGMIKKLHQITDVGKPGIGGALG